MIIDTKNIVSMTEANQNFSKIVKMVVENGMAVIMKNNKPKFVLVDFDEYEEFQLMKEIRVNKINDETDQLITENLEAFLELAK